MTIFDQPGAEGSLMSFQPRYDNYIGGEWVAPVGGPLLREPDAGYRRGLLRGRSVR